MTSLQILDSAPSTMDVARDNLRAGRVRFDADGRAAPPGVMAREQTAGRGQRGRTWFAPAGECLCATYYVALGATQTAGQAGELAFVAGVALAEMLQKLCRAALPLSASDSASRIAVGLKWPNDALLNGKKAGGILIEMAQDTSARDVALVGVGLNVDVRAFPPELDGLATSLWREGLYPQGAMASGEEAQTDTLTALGQDVGDALERWAQRWRLEGFAPVLARWREFDVTPGRVYETMMDGATARGVAVGVEANGALRLRLEDGRYFSARSATSMKEVAPLLTE